MLVVLPILWLVLLSGCPGAAADHERLGDRAYREERYEDALAEYLAAQRSNAFRRDCSGNSRRSWRSEFGAHAPRTLAARGAVPLRRSTMRSPPLNAELP